MSGSVVKNIDFSLHFDTERFETVAVLIVFAKLQKCIYTYYSLQFPIKITTSGSKTLTHFISFHTSYD